MPFDFCTYYNDSSIKIGTVDQTPEQVAENILYAIDSIVDKIPKKWNNVQSLHIKTSESVSLPIFNSLPDIDINQPISDNDDMNLEAEEGNEAEEMKNVVEKVELKKKKESSLKVGQGAKKLNKTKKSSSTRRVSVSNGKIQKLE